MIQAISVVGIYVSDQEEAIRFYVDKLGFQIKSDFTNGTFRWLTIQHPSQPSFQLGLFKPGPPTHDDTTATTLLSLVARGAMAPLVLTVDDCNAVAAKLKSLGILFTEEPTERYGSIDACFSDPFGNSWKMVQASQRPG